MAIHSSTVAWKIPWTEEPRRLQSMGLQSWTWFRSWTTKCIFYFPFSLSDPLYLKGVSCRQHIVESAKLLQSCLTLCDPIDGSPPGFAVPGILQARTLEWVAISFSSAWTWKGKVKSLSRVRLFATPWTVAYEAPLSMGFPRQEYWSGMPLPSPINFSTYPQKSQGIASTIVNSLRQSPRPLGI